jgi:two-component system, sensor histidine kinase PdtaS
MNGLYHRMIFRVLLSATACLLALTAPADDVIEKELDSLRIVIETQKDTALIKSIIRLNNFITTNQPREALDYLSRALAAAEELDHGFYKAELMSLIGVCHYTLADYDAAKSIWLEGLSYCESLIDQPEYLETRTKLTHSTLLSNLGVLYKVTGDYVSALDYYQQSLEIRKKTGSKYGIGICYLNIGNIYVDNKNDELGLSYYLKAEQMFIEADNRFGVSGVLNNIALVYQRQKDFEKAQQYFERALSISVEINDRKKIAQVYNNIGHLYQEFDDCDKALDYYSLSLIIRKEIEDKQGIASCYQHIAECYVKTKQHQEAVDYFKKAIEINDELNLVKSRLECYQGISALYYTTGAFKEAYEYKDKYISLSDSIFSSEMQLKLAEQEAKYENVEKEKQLAIKDLEISKQKAELGKRNLYNWFLVIGLLFIVAIAIIYIQRFRIMSNLRNQLEEQNNELKKTYGELSKTVVSKEEKEVMLKEIHHRVKNNLQIISSLINFQANTVTDPKVKELFRECQNRIISMSLLHEQLYKANDLASVNVEQYFTMLLENLLLIYADTTDVEVDLKIDVESFGVDTLIPIGLLVNEAVSNSLKYAFIGRKKGLVTIKLRAIDADKCELVIADNGVGLSEDKFPDNSDSLGMELIQTFISQLDGEVVVDNRNGTSYTIQFFPVKRSRRHLQ